MRAAVSFPKGVDAEQATAAARAFFREAFADNHEYVFAADNTGAHFQVHIMVQAVGYDGKKMRIGRKDIQDLRMMFAEQAEESAGCSCGEAGSLLDAGPCIVTGPTKLSVPVATSVIGPVNVIGCGGGAAADGWSSEGACSRIRFTVLMVQRVGFPFQRVGGGQPRDEVLLHLGQPTQTHATETGRTDIFHLQRGNQPSTGGITYGSAQFCLDRGLE